MSEEKDSQSKKSTSLLTTIESGLLNLANNHIRAIQVVLNHHRFSGFQLKLIEFSHSIQSTLSVWQG